MGYSYSAPGGVELGALSLAIPTAGITQTYATADATLAARTAAAITDNSGGTSGGTTVAAIGGAIDPTAALKADTANAVATLVAMANKSQVDLLDLTQAFNALVNQLRTALIVG